MFKKIAIVVVVLIAALLGFAATKPDTFRVQRTTSIKAPPEKIFPLINDLHNWASWSPYEKKDPGMNRTHSGAANGKGAVYEWEGNGDVGKGRMQIIDTAVPNKVTIKLDFVKPFEAHNIVDFTLQPKGDTTQVAWEMRGPAPFISKVMQVFVDMDSMVGKDFEAGLANLKALTEK
jgi:uncharacterized protein YndB with AHSA1/START domain